MKYILILVLLSGCAESMVKKCSDLGTIAVKDSKGEDACWTGHEVIYPANNKVELPREGRR